MTLERGLDKPDVELSQEAGHPAGVSERSAEKSGRIWMALLVWPLIAPRPRKINHTGQEIRQLSVSRLG